MTVAVAGRTYRFGLPDRLRVAREQAGFGQRELAEATGISRQSIGNYEAGHTTPRKPQLAAWAMATGFSLAWLESGVEPDPDGDLETVRREGIEPPTRWFSTTPSQRLVLRAA